MAQKYLKFLSENRVDTSLIQTCNEPTGSAMILSYPDGENSIVIVAGANGTFKEIPLSWVKAV